MEQDLNVEPLRKKRKGGSDKKMSDELLIYVINKYGRNFYTAKADNKKFVVKLIEMDLKDNNKDLKFDHKTIARTLTNARKRFLTLKENTSSDQALKIEWPLYDVFINLGDIIEANNKKRLDNSGSSINISDIQKEEPTNEDMKAIDSKENGSKVASTSHEQFLDFPGETSMLNNQPESFITAHSNFEPLFESLLVVNQDTDQSNENPMKNLQIHDEKDVTEHSIQSGILFNKTIGLSEKMKIFFGDYDKPRDTSTESNDVKETLVMTENPINNSEVVNEEMDVADKYHEKEIKLDLLIGEYRNLIENERNKINELMAIEQNRIKIQSKIMMIDIKQKEKFAEILAEIYAKH